MRSAEGRRCVRNALLKSAKNAHPRLPPTQFATNALRKKSLAPPTQAEDGRGLQQHAGGERRSLESGTGRCRGVHRDTPQENASLSCSASEGKGREGKGRRRRRKPMARINIHVYCRERRTVAEQYMFCIQFGASYPATNTPLRLIKGWIIKEQTNNNKQSGGERGT